MHGGLYCEQKPTSVLVGLVEWASRSPPWSDGPCRRWWRCGSTCRWSCRTRLATGESAREGRGKLELVCALSTCRLFRFHLFQPVPSEPPIVGLHAAGCLKVTEKGRSVGAKLHIYATCYRIRLIVQGTVGRTAHLSSLERPGHEADASACCSRTYMDI